LCFNAFPAGVTIQLDLWQSGVFRKSLENPLHTSEALYCFPVDPAAPFDPATSFDPAAPFDFIARAKFPSGVVISIGTAQEGVIPGLNNDYTAEPCCGFGANLVRNGDFESGNKEFASAFTYEPFPASASAVLPGEYAVIDETQSAAISPTWIAKSHEACDSTGKFLAVNGYTGNPGSRMVWSQTISVVPETGYQFCVYLRNLEQCALDVKPKVSLRFSSPPEMSDSSVIVAGCSVSCDWRRQTQRIVIPAGVDSLTAEIWLDESGEGDGNDLAIDDISLRKRTPEAP
jgi:hypothetical protein